MQKKASDFVNKGINTLQCAVDELNKACNMADEPANRAKIEKAISDVNCACNHLESYKK